MGANAIFITVLLLCCGVGNAEAQHGNKPLDVLMLLDSSDGQRSTDFEAEKEFAKQLTRLLWNNDNKIGLYTFGAETHSQFSFNTYQQEAYAITAIRYMWFSTGVGLLENALEFTLDNAFTSNNGERDCVPNILIVLTHSGFTNTTAIAEIRQKMMAKSVSTVIINMVQGTDDHGLQTIVSNQSKIVDCPDFRTLHTLPHVVFNLLKSESLPNGCGVLSSWGSWSRCSVTCGHGLKFRVRTCHKIHESDKDCYGERSEDMVCSSEPCTDPIDGGWSDWGSWGKCSKTCRNGTQTRSRACTEPVPEYGGKLCPGTNVQHRTCADWQCPDCGKVCPAGGHLSSDCQICECASVTLYGQIMDDVNAVVQEANVYLESRLYKPIAVSNDLGRFSKPGVCIMKENLRIMKAGYSYDRYTLVEMNSTHWKVNATLTKTVVPMFRVNPETKIRMVGQNASLCCSAVGIPSPVYYKWFKNGIELENVGTNGKLDLTSLTTADSGRYKCTTETDAGVSQSDVAVLTVKVTDGSAFDTCEDPISKLESLPPTCFLQGDSTKNSTFDVRTCGHGKCISTLHVDNGTCTDWWPHTCCDVDVTEPVDIICDGFSYKTSRVKSCKCIECISKTAISGRAFGIINGTTVPFKLGNIFLNGGQIARSTMAGYFRFDAPKGIQRAIINFHDDVFKLFLDQTKIVDLKEGVETYISVTLPAKPTPIAFKSDVGTDISLGGDAAGTPPVGTISIPDNALMAEDGTIFSGKAKASVKFIDPRSQEDMTMTTGDFVYDSSGGDKLPLRTYGMFHIGLEDDKGNPLQTRKPFSCSFDMSILNVTTDINGNPDLSLWYYDINKGAWTEQTKMLTTPPTAGRRKLLANVLTSSLSIPTINKMDPFSYSYHTESRPQPRPAGYIGNYDTPIYKNVQVKDSKLKTGLCYVSVSVYADFTLRKTMTGVTVTAFSREKAGPPYLGTESRPVDINGHVCLLVFCDKMVFIYAEKGGTLLFPAKHSLPDYYPVYNTTKKQVQFESRNFGSAYDCPAGQNCNGPMFPYKNGGQQVCKNSHSDSSFRFRFAPFTTEPQLSSAVGSTNVYDKPLSWYPVSPASNTYRSCFIKIQVKVQENYDLRILASSYLNKVENNSQFGTYNAGPVPNPKTNDNSNRAACMEFRCAGFVKNGSQEFFTLPTIVVGKVATTNKTLNCRSSIKSGLKITMDSDGKGFTFVAEAGQNYGPRYGVFINDDDAAKVQDFCYSGVDAGPAVDGLMNPDKNPAISFDCLA